MTTPLIGNVSFYDMNMYFFIYAFLGWVLEVIYATLKTGKFVNRGFLNGPVCPIYGVGIAVLVLLLNPISDKWWLLFIVGSLFATVLEFLTGFILDKIFKAKWWDYHDEHFNLLGYVCLKFSLIWGVAVVLVFEIFVPVTNKLIDLIPFNYFGMILLILLWIVLIIDIISDVFLINKLKKDMNEYDRIAELYKEGSDKIGEKISDATVALSEKLKVLGEKISKTRIVKAFPKLNIKRKKDKENK